MILSDQTLTDEKGFSKLLSANKKGFCRQKDERTRGTTLIHVYHNEKTNIFRSG